MPTYERYVVYGPEAAYGTAVAPSYRLDIASESLELKKDIDFIDASRRHALMRTTSTRRNVGGSVDGYLGFYALQPLLRYLIGEPVETGPAAHVYSRVYTPSLESPPASLTFDAYREIQIHRYAGCFFTGAKLSINQNAEHFGLSLAVLGADESLEGAAGSVADGAFDTPISSGNAQEGGSTPLVVTVDDGSTTWTADASSLEIELRWDRVLRFPSRRLVPTGFFTRGRVTAKVRLRWVYGTDTSFVYDAYRSGADVAITAIWYGALIGSTGVRKSFKLEFPRTRTTGKTPTVRNAGKGNIDHDMPFEALYSETGGYGPFRATLVSDVPISRSAGGGGGGGGNDPSTELLINGDFEDALTTPWIQATGTGMNNRTGVPPGPQAGTYYGFVGQGANCEIYQDVDVSGLGYLIDSGAVRFTFSGWTSSLNQAGAGSDSARITVEYRDSSAAVLDSYDTGNTVNPDTWVEYSDTRAAPAGTRTIRVRLRSIRHVGTNCDGYYDSLSLTVDF